MPELANIHHFIQKRKPKTPYVGMVGLKFNKNYCPIFSQSSRICETIKFHPKQEKINLGPKMLYWVFGLECSKPL